MEREEIRQKPTSKAVIRKELGRVSREQFYVMVRAYFPDAVIIPETDYDSMMWLFGYDRKTNKNIGTHRGSAMIMGTRKGVYLYVGNDNVVTEKFHRLCKTKNPVRFMGKLKKLSEWYDHHKRNR